MKGDLMLVLFLMLLIRENFCEDGIENGSNVAGFTRSHLNDGYYLDGLNEVGFSAGWVFFNYIFEANFIRTVSSFELCILYSFQKYSTSKTLLLKSSFLSTYHICMLTVTLVHITVFTAALNKADDVIPVLVCRFFSPADLRPSIFPKRKFCSYFSFLIKWPKYSRCYSSSLATRCNTVSFVTCWTHKVLSMQW